MADNAPKWTSYRKTMPEIQAFQWKPGMTDLPAGVFEIENNRVQVNTPSGEIAYGPSGSWIVRDTEGNHHLMDMDLFKSNYEAI